MIEPQFLLRWAISAFLDYLRWTQLVPMILMWFLIVGMSFVLMFAYNEDAAWSIVDIAFKTIQSLPFIGERFESWMASQTTEGVFSPDLGAIDWKGLALKIWAAISIIFMLLAGLLKRLLGPLPELTLKRKLALAAAASSLVVLGMVFLMEMDGGGETEGILPMLGSASLNGVAIFLVCAWCLSIAHGLGLLSAGLMQAGLDASDNHPGGQAGSRY